MFFILFPLSLALAAQEVLESCPCSDSKIGDNYCHEDCNIEECDFDGGDCDGLECTCDPSILGDGNCDWLCVNYACGWDAGDCCENWMLYNSVCDAACYTEEFKLDNGDCRQELGPCKCSWRSVGDDDCKYECSDHPECLDDLGDCCFEFEVGDGHCEEYCYDPNHDWDGGDCFKHPPEECAGWEEGVLGDGTCDEEYNTEECWYDMGDCCYPEMLGNGVCDPSCNNSFFDYDGGDCDPPAEEEDTA